MKITDIKFVYFSPTQRTKQVILEIAKSIELDNVNIEFLDITSPKARKTLLVTSKSTLLLVAVPVYMGRVPEIINDWLNSIRAEKTPAVSIVVYGNRVYDDALLELRNILTKCGCLPFAAGAFIGQHSFSHGDLMTAEGRPDKKDLVVISEFGRKITEKVKTVSSSDDLSIIDVAGVLPYRSDSKLWDVDFIEVTQKCTHCGICVDCCPAGAIDVNDPVKINIVDCITCCACIKQCPNNARIMKPSLVTEAAKRLHSLYSERKEPEYFI